MSYKKLNKNMAKIVKFFQTNTISQTFVQIIMVTHFQNSLYFCNYAVY